MQNFPFFFSFFADTVYHLRNDFNLSLGIYGEFHTLCLRVRILLHAVVDLDLQHSDPTQ